MDQMLNRMTNILGTLYMTSLDCYKLALHLFEGSLMTEEIQIATSWMKEAASMNYRQHKLVFFSELKLLKNNALTL
jgi:hypothetical protein